MNVNEVANFSRDLAALVRMGMPLTGALEFIGRQDPDPATRKTAQGMAVQMARGVSMAQAVGDASFPRTFTEMITLGEKRECVVDMLGMMADYFDEARRVRLRARDALLYPTGILLSCVVIALVMGYTMSAFLPAEVAVNVSSGFTLAIAFLLGAAAIGLIVVVLLPTPAGDWLRWRLPFSRGLWRDSSSVLLCRSLALALQSGASVPEALRLAQTADETLPARQALLGVASEVEKGVPLSSALHEIPFLNPALIEAVRSGEMGEDLPRSLLRVADMLERTIAWKTATLLAWLEPGAILAVGGVCGLVILAFWVPYYRFVGTLIHP